MAQVAHSVRTRGRSRRVSTRRGSSGGTEWILTSHIFTLTPTVPHLAVLLVPNEILNFMTAPTYLGGHIEVCANAVLSPPDPPGQGFVSLGIRPLSLRSFEAFDGIPPSELPLPWTDGEGSWAYHRMFYISAGSIDVSSAGATGATEHSVFNTVRFHDVARSARRLQTDEVLAMVAELSGIDPLFATGNICVAVTARVLLREK